MGIGFRELLILVAVLLLILIPYWLFGPISRKAGYSSRWGLLMWIPLVNVVLIWIFAFARWPNQSDTAIDDA